MRILYPNPPHWVGDGFFVQTLLDIRRDAHQTSPFLMIDYAAPKTFLPSQKPYGVGQHPHRGFETVTLVLQGEIAHRDTAGHYDIIRAGGVQWMTAANGILHEEFQSAAFSQSGGVMEMVQIWVNLPRQYKRVAPRYQSITPEAMVKIPLSMEDHDVIGQLTLIAGEYDDHGIKKQGGAKTYSPLLMAYIELNAEVSWDLPHLPMGWPCQIACLAGEMEINAQEIPSQPSLVILESHLDSNQVTICTKKSSRFVLLAGAPLNEPIAHYGPFVMNTREDLQETFKLYQSGKFGQ